MKDYKPTIGGSVVRNSNMLENYLLQVPEDKLFIINLDGDIAPSSSIENGVMVYRRRNLKELIKKAVNIIQTENISVIQAHNFRFLFAAFCAKTIARKKLKIYVEIHAMYHMSWYKERISRHLLRKADKIVVLAECAKKYLVDNNRISPDKIFVVRNGIDESVHKETIADENFTKQVIQAKEEYLIALYSGSFIEWQGVNFIADNFDNLLDSFPNLAIVMVGNGPDYDYVSAKSLSSKYKDRILLHHGISKQELLSLYDFTDILLIPRLKTLSTNTAVPLKVIEAMEYGMCIVSANDNGLLEALDDSNAFLFESGSINSLTSSLKEAIDYPEKRERLAEKARKDAGKLFVSWQDNAKVMKDLYHNF